MRRQATRVAALLVCAATSGCWFRGPREIVVYTALDQEFSEPILKQFTAETGINVRAKYDVESTKTVGLTNAIIQEANRPRCDLFWNNEILNTLRLKQRGLLSAYVSSAGLQFPAAFRAEDGSWHGFAARARVLLVNTELVPEDQRPTSVWDLVEPKWKDRVGIAKPLFGTTATHATVLFHHWGTEQAQAFFHRVRDNAQVLSGNKQVAIAVARGQLAWGLTDTDDAMIELEQGHPVTIVYPDQQEGQMGTLFIPNTLAVIKGAPHSELAQQLVDYLLSPSVEAALARGRSAQIPLNPDVQVPPRVASPATVRAMTVDFQQAAERWDTAAPFLREVFVRAE